ncbi:MAG: thioredoxin family protein [Candidatus Omnitrophica bacterium]|nr:thioredoxin family protein [Candidatus Omnitrophota bacterium]
MKRYLLIILAAVAICSAEAPAPVVQPTVNDLFPGLASGCLMYAVPAEMPKGTLLKCGPIVLTEKDLESQTEKLPEPIREQFKKNAFFLLEQVATEKLLAEAARRHFSMEKTPQDNRTLINRYFQSKLHSLTVTDTEALKFFQDNRDAMAGASFEQVKSSVVAFLRQEKQKKALDEIIRNLSRLLPVEVNAAWTRQQVTLAKDNPVDRARASGLPTLVDFGADGCLPCDMMSPILETIKTAYAGKLNVVFVHVRQEPILSARYGIQSIPVQIFFDKNGQEVFRHTGFLAQPEIEKKLAEIGVK